MQFNLRHILLWTFYAAVLSLVYSVIHPHVNYPNLGYFWWGFYPELWLLDLIEATEASFPAKTSAHVDVSGLAALGVGLITSLAFHTYLLLVTINLIGTANRWATSGILTCSWDVLLPGEGLKKKDNNALPNVQPNTTTNQTPFNPQSRSYEEAVHQPIWQEGDARTWHYDLQALPQRGPRFDSGREDLSGELQYSLLVTCGPENLQTYRVGEEAEIDDYSPYCPECGACGESGCCSPKRCHYLEYYQKEYDDMVKDSESLWHIRKEVQGWLDKQSHDRCWYYPEIFRKIAAYLEIKATGDPMLPPKHEFQGGCSRYTEEEYAKLHAMHDEEGNHNNHQLASEPFGQNRSSC